MTLSLFHTTRRLIHALLVGCLVRLQRVQEDLDRLRLYARRILPLLRGPAELQELGKNRDDNKTYTRQDSQVSPAPSHIATSIS